MAAAHLFVAILSSRFMASDDDSQVSNRHRTAVTATGAATP